MSVELQTPDVEEKSLRSPVTSFGFSITELIYFVENVIFFSLFVYSGHVFL